MSKKYPVSKSIPERATAPEGAASTSIGSDAAISHDMAVGAQFLRVVRERTQGIHRELEHCLSLDAATASLATWRHFLLQFARVYLPLEHRLSASSIASDPVLKLGERLRATDLLEDIEYADLHLGDSAGHDFKCATSTPTLPVDQLLSLPEAVGVLYVLEGSRFGGGQILTKAGALGIDASEGGRFFAGYQDQTVGMWKSFLSWIDLRLAPHEVGDAAEMSEAVFEIFVNQFS